MKQGKHPVFADQTWLARAIWLALAGVAGWALVQWRLELAFVASATLLVSLLPVFVARWTDVHVPPSFMAAVVLFVGGTLFLGEVHDFYGRFWWWDMVMHGSSAVGFGLIGFVLVFILFQGDRYAAPHLAMAALGFCFAVTIGTGWEIFEFAMDQLFGFNMQKSGLMDTMGDLVVNMIGAILGSAVGYAYLRGQARGGVATIIDEFVRSNPRFFKRLRKKK